jgi:hypothetical protein
MLPAEIHDPAARAAVQASHERAVAEVAAAAGSSSGGLTPQQIAITAVFGIVLFAGIFLALLKFGGS